MYNSNSTKNLPPELRTDPLKKLGFAIYFIVWVIATLVSWYYLEFIKLGEFFALSVVLPCVIVLFAEWIQLLG